MKEKFDKINELLENAGGEPEYLLIKSPIKDDTLGWFGIINWMHHDGEIQDSPIWRDSDLENLLDRVIQYLEERREHYIDIPNLELEEDCRLLH